MELVSGYYWCILQSWRPFSACTYTLKQTWTPIQKDIARHGSGHENTHSCTHNPFFICHVIVILAWWLLLFLLIQSDVLHIYISHIYSYIHIIQRLMRYESDELWWSKPIYRCHLRILEPTTFEWTQKSLQWILEKWLLNGMNRAATKGIACTAYKRRTYTVIGERRVYGSVFMHFVHKHT